MKKSLLFFTILFAFAVKNSAQVVVNQTAGNLGTVAASYLSNASYLKVTGTIDARDFKTMRDDMPLLNHLDLSECTISAYIGTEGTGGTYTTFYPSNEIPAYAFCHPLTWKSKENLRIFDTPTSVTSIGDYAFYSCSGLAGSLSFPSSVTSIGNFAFVECSGFTGSLTIPESVTTIGTSAFHNCSNFTGSLTIPESVTTIGESAFSGCSGFKGSLSISISLTIIEFGTFSGCYGFTGTLTIPVSVTIIEGCAFSGCRDFTGSLSIPPFVTSIGSRSFAGCTGFTGSLTIPSSVTSIGYTAFDNCSFSFNVESANENYSSLNDVLFNKDKTTLIQCPNSKTGTYTIPTSVTTICDFAFRNCSELTGSLTIPSSVTSIGIQAFLFSSASFIVDSANEYYSSFNGVLFNKDKTKLIQCPISQAGSYTIPATVTTIGEYAFTNCKDLTGPLIIPELVSTIEDGAFQDCSGFTGSLTIPYTVTTIGALAFIGCRGLSGSLTIQSPSTTTIDHFAFSYCTGFTSIYAYAKIPINIDSSWDVFMDINKSTCILHVPVGSKELYKVAYQWKDFINIVDDIITTTSLNEISSNSITLYPNPANSTITVSELGTLANDNALTLSITDISGNTLLTNSIEPTLNSVTIDVGSLSSGAYVMVIQSSNGNVVKSFLKK